MHADLDCVALPERRVPDKGFTLTRRRRVSRALFGAATCDVDRQRVADADPHSHVLPGSVAQRRQNGGLLDQEQPTVSKDADFSSGRAEQSQPYATRDVCVPKTSSASCDQVVFVDQPTDTSLFSDAVLAEVDRFG
jgi:hypothetical protein